MEKIWRQNAPGVPFEYSFQFFHAHRGPYFLSGFVRAGGVQRRAAQQGDRHPESSGRQRGSDYALVVDGFPQARGAGICDCDAGCVVVYVPVAGDFRLPDFIALVDVRIRRVGGAARRARDGEFPCDQGGGRQSDQKPPDGISEMRGAGCCVGAIRSSQNANFFFRKTHPSPLSLPSRSGKKLVKQVIKKSMERADFVGERKSSIFNLRSRRGDFCLIFAAIYAEIIGCLRPS